MTIAADPSYRDVRAAWTNVGAAGDELVQLFARPLGGAWALAATWAVVLGDQIASWATARPVTSYDLAMRLARGVSAAVGYEGNDPDLWTAPTAALSKSTVITMSADVVWGAAPAFVNAATPMNLTWTSPQVGAPYLLEKFVGGIWVTVAADLVATSYAYAIPAGELNLTIPFRLTAQRGAVAGPTAGTLNVAMFITVGQPAWVSATFTPSTRAVALSWTTAAFATTYFLEKDAGAGWVTVGTIGGTSYSYTAPDAEINTTVNYRVTGKNGAVSGTVSATQPLTLTLVIGTPVISSAVYNPVTGRTTVQWGAVSGATSYLLEKNAGAGWVTAGTTSLLILNNSVLTAEVNTTLQFRVTGKNGTIAGTPSATSNVAQTTTLVAPGAPVIGAYTGSTPAGSGSRYAITWAQATGDVYVQEIQVFRGGVWGGQSSGSGSGVVYWDAPAPTATRIRASAAGGALVADGAQTAVTWP